MKKKNRERYGRSQKRMEDKVPQSNTWDEGVSEVTIKGGDSRKRKKRCISTGGEFSQQKNPDEDDDVQRDYADVNDNEDVQTYDMTATPRKCTIGGMGELNLPVPSHLNPSLPKTPKR